MSKFNIMDLFSVEVDRRGCGYITGYVVGYDVNHVFKIAETIFDGYAEKQCPYDKNLVVIGALNNIIGIGGSRYTQSSLRDDSYVIERFCTPTGVNSFLYRIVRLVNHILGENADLDTFINHVYNYIDPQVRKDIESHNVGRTKVMDYYDYVMANLSNEEVSAFKDLFNRH